jgi:hypothetical protein
MKLLARMKTITRSLYEQKPLGTPRGFLFGRDKTDPEQTLKVL